MLNVVIDRILDDRLRQMAADLEITPEEAASILLESAIVMEGTRS